MEFVIPFGKRIRFNYFKHTTTFKMRFIKWTPMKIVVISSALIFQVIGNSLFGQTGGQSSFLFLNLSPSARNTALGSYAISWLDLIQLQHI